MKITSELLGYIVKSLVTFIFLITLIQCEEMQDTYKEFIGDGEIIYVGKADSIKIRAGKERLEISWLLLSDPKVSSYKIFWNNKNDSISNNVIKTDDVDTVRVMLEGLPEYVYNFDIYMFDNLGNSSIQASTVGRTYGDFYQGSLFNRLFTQSRRLSNGVEITWASPSDDFVSLELEYLDVFGNIIEKNIDRTVEKDTLFNIPVNGSFSYYSLFKPEPDALDVFEVEPEVIELAH